MRVDSWGPFGFSPQMRFRVLLLLGFTCTFVTAGEIPSSIAAHRSTLESVLKTFQIEAPRGWSFTQTTEGDGHSRVERYDATQPEFNRWTLLQENGRPPTPDERQDYIEKLSRRSRGGTAPRLIEQLDLSTLEVSAEDAERTTYRMRLKPGEEGDATAKFLQASVVLHKPTHSIESFSLASIAPFSPTFGVKIETMQTTMTYSLPDPGRPALLQKSLTHLRGRAFLFKSLDADLTVTFTAYDKATRRTK